MAEKVIYIGSDHAGFEMKEKVKKWLMKKGYDVKDVGAYTYNKTDDYPVFAEKLGRSVVKIDSRGILFCGSSTGVCIAANKVQGVRAAASTDNASAKLSREHNDANVLCLSAWMLSEKKAEGIIEVWLNTKFSGEARHIRRINLIKKLENKR